MPSLDSVHTVQAISMPSLDSVHTVQASHSVAQVTHLSTRHAMLHSIFSTAIFHLLTRRITFCSIPMMGCRNRIRQLHSHFKLSSDTAVETSNKNPKESGNESGKDPRKTNPVDYPVTPSTAPFLSHYVDTILSLSIPSPPFSWPLTPRRITKQKPGNNPTPPPSVKNFRARLWSSYT
ncbi:hypothetical protein N658DRAFT_284208 [Parathielavia hyrcaniae]|uniref:Uncharacterized protein n=1 Tax=Parathielavia hyrcaniae TaxID=113614 RepID=A0AAN6QA32_9PEZI|nr:hypothetical protein N658DRAFT_284208 [Parathielavia hyrcaniae]